ncbi:LOW QUALITY PROTEIN: formin-like protein 3 [Rhinopithecus roxellana]|uniref:LOW QUALITY PROTEIN: formin-like protein 3 n=1 Tax=Rhinopithecus roxellana TaxID=61622 RepID=UPI00123770A1|nr:LOW QUALITY PROTEIN: formin-like protein 3 [Rhinopithecus roxellana]
MSSALAAAAAAVTIFTAPERRRRRRRKTFQTFQTLNKGFFFFPTDLTFGSPAASPPALSEATSGVLAAPPAIVVYALPLQPNLQLPPPPPPPPPTSRPPLPPPALVPRPTSPAAAEKREERGALGPQRGPNPLLRRRGAPARFRRSANLFPLLFLLPQGSVRSGGEEDDPCLVRATLALLLLSFSVASEAQLPAPPPVPCVFLAPCLFRHGLRAQQGVFTCAHRPGLDAGGPHRGRRRGLGFAPCFSSPCPPTSGATLDFLPSAPGSGLTARRVQLPGLAEPRTLPGLQPRGVWA